MEFQTVLVAASSCLSALGMWFIYDVIREFKDFKKNTMKEMVDNKHDRERFELTVKNYEVTIRARVSELISTIETYKTNMERSLNIIDTELTRVRMSITTANEKAQKFEDFMTTAYKLMNAINSKNKVLEEQINLIKK